MSGRFFSMVLGANGAMTAAATSLPSRVEIPATSALPASVSVPLPEEAAAPTPTFALYRPSLPAFPGRVLGKAFPPESIDTTLDAGWLDERLRLLGGAAAQQRLTEEGRISVGRVQLLRKMGFPRLKESAEALKGGRLKAIPETFALATSLFADTAYEKARPKILDVLMQLDWSEVPADKEKVGGFVVDVLKTFLGEGNVDLETAAARLLGDALAFVDGPMRSELLETAKPRLIAFGGDGNTTLEHAAASAWLDLAPHLTPDERSAGFRAALVTLKKLCWTGYVEAFQVEALSTARRFSRMLARRPDWAEAAFGGWVRSDPLSPADVDRQVAGMTQKGADFRTYATHDAAGGLVFFRTRLAEAVASGFFDRAHVAAIIDAVDSSYGKIPLKFLTENFGMLLKCGLVSGDHVTSLARLLARANNLTHAPLQALFTAHLGPLEAVGLFDREHVAILQDSSCDIGYEFLGPNLDFLIAKGLFDRENVARSVLEPSERIRAFFEARLGTLLDAGLYDAPIHARLVHNVLRASPSFGTVPTETVRILDAGFGLLLERGFFSRDDLGRILCAVLAGLRSTYENDAEGRVELDSVLRFLERHFPTLWDLGWMDAASEANRIRVAAADANFLTAKGAFRFYRTHLPFLVERGLFGREDYEALRTALAEAHVGLLPLLHGIFEDHLDLLLEKGIFDPETDLPRLALSFNLCPVDNITGMFRGSAVAFFERNFDLLVRRGLFRKHHLGALLRDSSQPDVNAVDDFLSRRFRAHTPETKRTEAGYFVAYEAWMQVDDFAARFHELRSRGILDAFTFAAFLGHARIPGPLAGAFLSLARSEEWLASPQRWKAINAFLTKIGSMSQPDRAVFTRLAPLFGGSPEETAAAVSFLLELEPDELVSVSDWIDDGKSRRAEADAIRAAFAETAEALGVSGDADVRALSAKIGDERWSRLALEWDGNGQRATWEKYAEEFRAAPNPKEARKVQKKFLNFAAAQSARTQPPSLVRVTTQATARILEEAFRARVSAEAKPGDAESLRRFFEGPVWPRFRTSRLYALCRKSSLFLMPNGMASLGRLLGGLKVEKDRFVFPRYGELRGVVGADVLEKWSQEYATTVDVAAVSRAEAERNAKALLKRIAVDQISGHAHAEVREGCPDGIRDLPRRVAAWVAAGKARDADEAELLAEARRLSALFTEDYPSIRKNFGDTFANIRTDLKNLLHGWDKGIRIARNDETFRVSGDAEILARSGSEPVLTCQNMEYRWVNDEGQPIHRILHGQFKVANWEMDGAVTARRLVELTVDGDGNEHLLVERLYVAGGFTRVDEFRRRIIDHAAELGIPESRVHFDDEPSKHTAPPAMNPGDPIYRDTFREGTRPPNKPL